MKPKNKQSQKPKAGIAYIVGEGEPELFMLKGEMDILKLHSTTSLLTPLKADDTGDKEYIH